MNNHLKKPELSEKRKQLMLAVINGNVLVPPHLFQFQVVADKSWGMELIFDDCLRWLIKNKLTGHRFVDWIKTEANNSSLIAFAELRRRVTVERELKEIYADNKKQI